MSQNKFVAVLKFLRILNSKGTPSITFPQETSKPN